MILISSFDVLRGLLLEDKSDESNQEYGFIFNGHTLIDSRSEPAISNENISLITTALSSPHFNLTTLILEKCNLNESAINKIAEAMRSSGCKLTRLKLSGNRIGSAIIAIAHTIQYPNRLVDLNLNSTLIDSGDVMALAAAMLSPYCVLNGICLTYNSIDEKGAIALAYALKSPSCKVREVSVVCNNRVNDSNHGIGDRGAAAFADAIQSANCRLNVLNMQDCSIGSKGIRALADAFRSPNCRLTWLSLKDNNIVPESVNAIIGALQFRLEQARAGISDYLVPFEEVRGINDNRINDLIKKHEILYQLSVFNAMKECCESDLPLELITLTVGIVGGPLKLSGGYPTPDDRALIADANADEPASTRVPMRR